MGRYTDVRLSAVEDFLKSERKTIEKRAKNGNRRAMALLAKEAEYRANPTDDLLCSLDNCIVRYNIQIARKG